MDGKDQNGQKPDKVRVNQHFWHSFFNIGDINNPYVNVLSTVNLESWLYKDNYNKSIVDIDKTGSTNMAVQLRKSFDKARLKVGKNDPGVLTGNLSNTKIWRPGQAIGRSIWPSQADPQQIKTYLALDTMDSNITKKITCRWQYYLDNTHALYAQYRVAIELTNFYTILSMLESFLFEFQHHINELEKNNNISVKDILDIISIIKGTNKISHAEYIIPHISVPPAEEHLANKVSSILTILISSNMLGFLQSIGDSTNGLDRGKTNTHISRYQVLFNILNNKILKIKKFQNRSIDYTDLSLNSIFSDWWNKIYAIMAKNNKNEQEFSLDSQKNLYTNNNKSPNNNINSGVKHGFNAFKDVDITAADYFSEIILNKKDPFIFDNISADEFFINQININIYGKIKDMNKLLEYINAFTQFNNLFKNISYYINANMSNKQSVIEAAAHKYIIVKN